MRDSAPKPFTRIHPLNTLPHFPSCSSCLLGLPSHLINKNEHRTAPHIPPELTSAGTQISLYYLLILQPFKENILTSSCKKNHCFAKMGLGLDLFYMKRKEWRLFYFYLLQRQHLLSLDICFIANYILKLVNFIGILNVVLYYKTFFV